MQLVLTNQLLGQQLINWLSDKYLNAKLETSFRNFFPNMVMH